MVINVPDSIDINTDATIANTDNPVKNLFTLVLIWLNLRKKIKTQHHATAIFVSTKIPDLLNTVTVAFTLIDVPMQNNQTNNINMAPAISSYVNDLKYFPVSGVNVCKHAHKSSSISLIPLGTLSMHCFYFIQPSFVFSYFE